MAKTRKYLVSKKEMVREHTRIIPELRKAGLRKEASEQSRELRKIRRK